MKQATSTEQSRPELVSTIVQAYMDLFMTMQFNAVSHWLMLELTFAQARALFMLAARQELTVSQLAKLLDIGKPTASILVQQLVERELVTRTEHETDRRHTIVRLSPKGAEIGAGRRKEREKQWQRWLRRLSDDELNALARGLSAIVAVVKQELEDETQQTIPSRSKPEEAQTMRKK
ncbi:MAG TPA: MarR family transcriptional regulator [Anaerolineales bacterium]|nr:MarR family transcriptional regulator [Anaerolineales bacterium]